MPPHPLSNLPPNNIYTATPQINHLICLEIFASKFFLQSFYTPTSRYPVKSWLLPGYKGQLFVCNYEKNFTVNCNNHGFVLWNHGTKCI